MPLSLATLYVLRLSPAQDLRLLLANNVCGSIVTNHQIGQRALGRVLVIMGVRFPWVVTPPIRCYKVCPLLLEGMKVIRFFVSTMAVVCFLSYGCKGPPSTQDRTVSQPPAGPDVLKVCTERPPSYTASVDSQLKAVLPLLGKTEIEAESIVKVFLNQESGGSRKGEDLNNYMFYVCQMSNNGKWSEATTERLINRFIDKWGSEPQSTAPVSAVRDPVIEVSYGLKGFGLPIPIEPSATAELILIREDRTVELQKITNGRNTRLQWPTAERIFPPESTGKITLSNHGDVGLFNISYSVKIAIQGQKVPGGVIEVPFTLPLHDLLSGKSQSFTIVNQSSFMTLLHFSEAATVEIQSQDQRRQVKVKARDITISDQLTYLQGSLHKWSGLKMLDPDQLKKNQKNDPPGRDHSGLAKD